LPPDLITRCLPIAYLSMKIDDFKGKIQKYCQWAGFSQKNLAGAVGLNPQVLSRKLNGIRHSNLTQLEVKQIIKTLAGWQAITRRDQAVELLELVDLSATIFTREEWQTPPLNGLTLRDMRARPGQEDLPDPGKVLTGKTTSLALKTKPEPIHNLPASATRLIGRDKLIQQVRQLLGREEVRLVTLLGPGGIGKTRVALSVARAMLGEFEDGVFFVPLASINDPQFVPSAILQMLQLKEAGNLSATAGLKQHLSNKKIFLVLDNFEQLLAGTGLLDELLAAAPGLKLLVTSQAVLHIYGEREFAVPPLELPDLANLPGPERLGGYEAVGLFLERAQAVQPTFSLTPDNYRAIAELCVRLEGLPLSIELSAVRLKMLSVNNLLEKLSDKRLPLLTRGAQSLPARQQTLRRTLEWSYNLLDQAEQQLFDRLGVFRNGWTVEAAHAVCGREAGSETDSMDYLSQLLDKSLVVRMDNQSTTQRFMMLETLREFAQERLEWRQEVELVQQRHAQFYLKLARKTEVKLRGPEQVVWLAQLDVEQENLRMALQWLIARARTGQAQTDPDSQPPNMASSYNRCDFNNEYFAGTALEAADLALHMAAAVALYWEIRGFYSEGRHWLAQVLDLCTGANLGVELKQSKANALNKAGDLAFLQGDFQQARLFLEESLALKRQLKDKPGIATVLNSFGNLEVWQRDFKRAIELVEESLAIRQELNDSGGIAIALRNLGNIYTATGEYQQAARAYTDSLKIAEKLHNKLGQATALGSLGKVLLIQSHYDQAVRLLDESLRLFEELGDKRRLAITLDLLGCVYMNQGHYEQAYQLSYKGLELERELGDRWGIAASLHNLGNVRVRQGQFNAARNLYLDSIEMLGEMGEKYLGDGLDNMAGLAVAQQFYERAAQLYAASDKIRQQTQSPRETSEQTTYTNKIAQIRSQLDLPNFEAAWSQGQELELEQALDLARSPNYLGESREDLELSTR
jgi:predicted ATPase/tetratricopeptide (TPR) repeat protein